jgi:hypothetical protein
MNEFYKNIWGFIFTSAGIVLGWGLNQIGQWFITRQEDKKNLKFVLFNLLETYYILNRNGFHDKIPIINEMLLALVPEDNQTEELKTFIKELLYGVVQKSIDLDLTKDLKLVQENYQKAIHTLATIDPITAYYLNGKANVIERLDNYKNSVVGYKDDISEEYEMKELKVEKVFNILKPEVLKDALIDLEDDIKEVAWKINPYAWHQSSKALKKLKITAEEDFEARMNIFLEKMKAQLFEL